MEFDEIAEEFEQYSQDIKENEETAERCLKETGKGGRALIQILKGGL